MFFQARTVAVEDEVTKSIQNAKGNFKRVEEVYDALVWRLARKPDSGTEISNEGHHLIKTADLAVEGVPVIAALYTFTEHQVDILSIKIMASNGR